MEEARSVVQEFGGSNDTKAADHAKSFLRVARVQTRCNLGFRLEPCAGWNYRSVPPDRAGWDSYSCRGPHVDSPIRVAAASNREVSCAISGSRLVQLWFAQSRWRKFEGEG